MIKNHLPSEIKAYMFQMDIIDHVVDVPQSVDSECASLVFHPGRAREPQMEPGNILTPG